jgi:RNA polymerase sigma-70 factor (ECF subfamily)
MDRTGAALHRLYRQALESDELQAWEEFVREAHTPVASAVYLTLARWGKPSKERVEDLVQETFLKLCEGGFGLLKAFRSDRQEALPAYLRAIAANVVIDAQRTRVAARRGSGAEPLELDEARNAVASDEASEHTVEAVERRMLVARVGECLSGCAARDRQVFWLYYRQGFTTKAIAGIAAFGLTESGVESLIRRLTLVARKCLNVPASREIHPVLKGNDS